MAKIVIKNGIPSDLPTNGYIYVYHDNTQLKTIDSNGLVTNLTNVSAGGSASMPNVILIDPNASEVVGKVYLDLPSAINFCNSFATSTNRYIILVTKNLILDSPITITNGYYGVTGLGLFSTELKISDTLVGFTAITINVTDNVTYYPFGNMNIVGSTALENGLNTIGMNVIGNGVCYVNDIRMSNFYTGLRINNQSGIGQLTFFMEGALSIRDCGLYGLYIGLVRFEATKIAIVESPNNIYLDNFNSSFILNNGAISAFTEPSTGNGIVMNSTGLVVLNNIFFNQLDTALIVNNNCRISLNSCQIEETNVKHVIFNSVCDVESNSIKLNLDRVFFNQIPTLNGTYLSNSSLGLYYRMLNNISVGLPNSPKKSYFGEGAPYNRAYLVYTFDGVTYTNVTTQATIESDGQTFTFPNNTLDNSIYISNLYSLKFFWIYAKITTVANLGSGNIVFEYWNGTQWIEFNHMVFNTDDNRTYANNKFSITGSLELHFDENLDKFWTANDPIGLGINLYWIRFRIASTINQRPVFDTIRIGTNSTELETDGNIHHYGLSRPIRKLPISWGTFAAAASAPNNVDIYLSDDVYSGLDFNSYPSNQNRSIGANITLPYDIDTSCPIKLQIAYTGDSLLAGTSRLVFYWDIYRLNTITYTSTASAPTSTATQRSLNRDISMGLSNVGEVKTEYIQLEIPEAISQKINTELGDSIIINIKRDIGVVGNYAGNFIIIDVAFYYTAFRNGGYLKLL